MLRAGMLGCGREGSLGVQSCSSGLLLPHNPIVFIKPLAALSHVSGSPAFTGWNRLQRRADNYLLVFQAKLDETMFKHFTHLT